MRAALLQLNLFDYPRRPGFKERTTSRDAATAIAGSAATLRAKVLSTIGDFPRGLTADQVARILGVSILSIRPRVSELAKAEKIMRTGERRANESGLLAAVWRRNG